MMEKLFPSPFIVLAQNMWAQPWLFSPLPPLSFQVRENPFLVQFEAKIP